MTNSTNKPEKKLPEPNLHSNKAVRWLFMFLGCLAFAIGFVGIFVPLLPTTPLVILAAACWAKGSQRFHDWIVAHPVFGKMVLDWRERRAIPRYAKYLAWSMMTISCCMIFYRLPTDWHWVGYISVVFSLSVAIWMAKLPNA